MKRRSVSALLGALIAWGGSVAAQTAASPQTLTLGVVPQFPAVETQRQWSPVTTWLEQVCQTRIDLVFSPGTPEFEQRFIRGQLDLAFVNPYHAVMAKKAQGYSPLVRDGASALKGILVVKVNGPIRQLQDLQDAKIAFPSPNAFGASLYMRALLEREHGIRFTTYYSKTHTNGYRHVLTGEAMAAGGIVSTLKAETPTVQQQLKVLYETPAVPPHPLVAHPRVPMALQRCLTEQLTRTDLPADIKAQLAEVLMPAPVVAVYARDYQPLEKLALEAYVVHNLP